MGSFIERISERKKGITVEPLAGYKDEFDIRFGNGWFGEVVKLGGAEALRWTSRELNFFTHGQAVDRLGQIFTGKPNLLTDPSGYKIKASFFIEPDDGTYSSEREVFAPYKNNHLYITARRESRQVYDGRKISVTHTIKNLNDNLIFSLQTIMHPPHEVAESILQVTDEYTDKWPEVYSWISPMHVNREKFGI